jgi:hypothetical protein
MKSPSLKRRHLELNLFKFINFLMRNGQREQTFRYLLIAFARTLAVRKGLFIANSGVSKNWLNLYFFLNNTIMLADERCASIPVGITGLVYNHSARKRSVTFSYEFRFKLFLSKLLRKVTPLFQFCVYNIAKNVRKFSRGKAGKYTFV